MRPNHGPNPHKQQVVLAPLLETERVLQCSLWSSHHCLSLLNVELLIVYLQSATNVLLTKQVEALRIG